MPILNSPASIKRSLLKDVKKANKKAVKKKGWLWCYACSSVVVVS